MATKPLSRERILSAAMAIADKQGVDKVTMRSVASKLGVEAMSLYHHVPNKQAMLDGLVDLIVQVAEFPEDCADVESWVRGTASSFRNLALAHPRLLEAFNLRSVPLDDPDAARPFESALRTFRDSGYSTREAFAALQAVSLALIQMAQLEAAVILDGGEHAGQQVSASVLPADAFPLLHEVFERPAGLDDFWRVLTDTLVRGLRPT